MKHVIFFSGGLGSFATAERVISEHGKKDTHLLFTDTLIEDEDLYRFIIDASEFFYDKKLPNKDELVRGIPKTSVDTMEKRKVYLSELGSIVSRCFENVHWINNGQDVWDVFREKKFLGNSRLAHCSHVLKQDMARKYIDDNFTTDDKLYLGIDWTEEHRTKAPKKNWSPYEVLFPMTQEPYVTNIDHIKRLESLNINVPRLYGMGFSHNNCGGFCVRGGQGHFINLLEQNPTLYQYHEEKEQEFRRFIDKDVSILRRQKNKVRHRLTLQQLRKEYEEKNTGDIDFTDVGGCGCFVTEEEGI